MSLIPHPFHNSLGDEGFGRGQPAHVVAQLLGVSAAAQVVLVKALVVIIIFSFKSAF